MPRDSEHETLSRDGSTDYGPQANNGQDKDLRPMIVSSIKNISRTPEPRPESPMEKTTRYVREKLDDEAQKRQAKTARLRAARLERDASMPVKTSAVKSMSVDKIPRVKTTP